MKIALLWQDVGQALRSLARQPFFALLIVGTLAVGIGVNTAMFSIVDRVLLNPLPYERPDRLVRFDYEVADSTVSSFGVNDAEVGEILQQAAAVESVGAYTYGGGTLSDGDSPEEPTSLGVTAGFFSTLDVQPLHGRLFSEEEYEVGGVAILGEEVWRRRYQADTGLIGRDIEMDGEPLTVVGVMPDAFRFPTEGSALQVFLPRSLQPERGFERRSYLSAFGRLRPGASLSQANEQLAALSAGLAERYPSAETARTFSAQPLADGVVDDTTERSLLLLWGAVGFVLLLACINAANLLLARGAARRQDIAVCSALGAPRWRILQRVLIESVALSLVAGGLGLLIAQWCIEALSRFFGNLPRAYAVGIDSRVFVAAFVMAILAGLAYGIIPALQLTRVDLSEALKQGGTRTATTRAGLRLRAGLTVAQVAIAFSLLIGAGLLIRSSLNLYATDPGFAYENRMTLSLWADLPRTEDDVSVRIVRRWNEILAEVRGTPGVLSANLVQGVPFMWLFDYSGDYRIVGHAAFDDGDPAEARTRRVSDRYLQDMDVALIAGRYFDDRDEGDGEPTAIVSEELARLYGAPEALLGESLRLGDDEQSWRIVGVVSGVRDRSLSELPRPTIYVPFEQLPIANMTIVAATAGDPQAMRRNIEQAVWRVNPTQGIWRTQTLESMLSSTLELNNLYTTLLIAFACIAIVLAAAGIYGVISFHVTQRTQEIGIRMALGATPGHVLGQVFREAGRLALIGTGLGLAGGIGTAMALKGLLFAVPAIDWITFLGVALIIPAVSLAACYLPARRATLVPPSICLRAV